MQRVICLRLSIEITTIIKFIVVTLIICFIQFLIMSLIPHMPRQRPRQSPTQTFVSIIRLASNKHYRTLALTTHHIPWQLLAYFNILIILSF